LNKRQK